MQIEEKDGKVILSWDAVENVTDYRIYEASGMFSEFAQAGEDIPVAASDMADDADGAAFAGGGLSRTG